MYGSAEVRMFLPQVLSGSASFPSPPPLELNSLKQQNGRRLQTCCIIAQHWGQRGRAPQPPSNALTGPPHSLSRGICCYT